MVHLLFSENIFYHKPKYEEITQSNPECANFKKIICLTFLKKITVLRNNKRWKTFKKQTKM